MQHLYGNCLSGWARNLQQAPIGILCNLINTIAIINSLVSSLGFFFAYSGHSTISARFDRNKSSLPFTYAIYFAPGKVRPFAASQPVHEWGVAWKWLYLPWTCRSEDRFNNSISGVDKLTVYNTNKHCFIFMQTSAWCTTPPCPWKVLNPALRAWQSWKSVTCTASCK